MVRYTENTPCAVILRLIFIILPIIAIVKVPRNYSWWPSMWLTVLGVSMIVSESEFNTYIVCIYILFFRSILLCYINIPILYDIIITNFCILPIIIFYDIFIYHKT